MSRRVGDERLARAAARGDERAFAAIHERYHQPLYAYCRSIVRHDEDALDALQATLTAAWTALRRERRTAPLRPWLYRIAHNESVSLLRRRARQPVVELDHADHVAGPSAAEDAGRRAEWELLMADLACLPEQARSALVLRELSGLAHDEIALALGTSVGAAKQSILEARRGLAEMAEGRAMPCEIVQERLSDGDGRVLRGRKVAAHLRDCPACTEFAAGIKSRRRAFGAYVPVISPLAADALLSHVLHGSGHVGGGVTAGGASAGGVSAAATGKTAGAVLGWKAAGVVAVVAAGASAGAVAVHRALAPRQTRPATTSGAVHRAHEAARHAPAAAAAATVAAHRAGAHPAAKRADSARPAHGHSQRSSPHGAAGGAPAQVGATPATHGKTQTPVAGGRAGRGAGSGTARRHAPTRAHGAPATRHVHVRTTHPLHPAHPATSAPAHGKHTTTTTASPTVTTPSPGSRRGGGGGAAGGGGKTATTTSAATTSPPSKTHR
jgi:RNA polymerase sigma factor (sigma-70 family)